MDNRIESRTELKSGGKLGEVFQRVVVHTTTAGLVSVHYRILKTILSKDLLTEGTRIGRDRIKKKRDQENKKEEDGI